MLLLWQEGTCEERLQQAKGLVRKEKVRNFLLFVMNQILLKYLLTLGGLTLGQRPTLQIPCKDTPQLENRRKVKDLSIWGTVSKLKL